MQPIHDELTMEQGMHVIAMKPVFKDIESKKPWTYADLIIRFNKVKALDITQFYLHTNLYDPNYASQDEPKNEDEDSSHSRMPSLLSYYIESDPELNDESDLDSFIDMTQMN